MNASGEAAIDVNGVRASANIINLVIFNLFIIKFREKLTALTSWRYENYPSKHSVAQ
ncbi:hypothetical protein [Citrobacter freundii]|uniref:Uncharacterized protein n=1 Tax=Citrobacter freundii TaxID=546 RepID=A0A7G2IJF9_CITFR|nr:hypothetical protein [Citrobacter freundii]